MGTSVEEFGSHRNWRPELGGGHVGSRLGESEISDDDTVIIQENVGQFEISMHNLVLVEFLESIHNLHQEINTLLFSETLVLLNVILNISIVAVVNNEVVIVSGLKIFVEMKNIWMLNFAHDSHFRVEKSSQLGVLVDFLLGDGFDGENFVGLLLSGFEHSTELPFTELGYEEIISDFLHYVFLTFNN